MIEFEEDDLPGWNMTLNTVRGVTQHGNNTSGYNWGYHVIDPAAEAEAKREYMKTTQAKSRMARYDKSDAGKERKKRWREKEGPKARAKEWRALWLKTPAGVAYAARKAEKAKERYANRRLAASDARPGSPHPRSSPEAGTQPSAE